MRIYNEEYCPVFLKLWQNLTSSDIIRRKIKLISTKYERNMSLALPAYAEFSKKLEEYQRHPIEDHQIESYPIYSDNQPITEIKEVTGDHILDGSQKKPIKKRTVNQQIEKEQRTEENQLQVEKKKTEEQQEQNQNEGATKVEQVKPKQQTEVKEQQNQDAEESENKNEGNVNGDEKKEDSKEKQVKEEQKDEEEQPKEKQEEQPKEEKQKGNESENIKEEQKGDKEEKDEDVLAALNFINSLPKQS
ncbi:hypothetical protein QTN25_009494 [Entamoeba marina]